MGGRNDVNVADSTAHDREQLAVKKLRKGNYLVEITRGDNVDAGARHARCLGARPEVAIPFELTGTHQTVGKIAVTMTSHLEPVNTRRCSAG